MIVGISGSQGQGKSTLIKEVANTNPDFIAADIQTARNVLAAENFTLDDINSNKELKKEFQEKFFIGHMMNISTLDHNKKNMVERTFADVYAYALVALGPFNEYSEWLCGYKERCIRAQNLLFDRVIYLSGRVYTPEGDGVRSTNQDFSILVDSAIRRFSDEFTDGGVILIDMPDLEERIDQLSEIMTNGN